MKTAFRFQRTQGQSGIVLFEFTIGILAVLLLMMATAEIGRVFQSYNVLHKSVRAGARYLSAGALNDLYQLDLSEDRLIEARNLILSGKVGGGEGLLKGFTEDNITISEVFPSGNLNPYVRVEVQYDYNPVFTVIPGFHGGDEFNFDFELFSAVTMRAQR